MCCCCHLPTACRDVLCTDKTGTLTQDKVTLVRYCSPTAAEPCMTVLGYAYCNSAFQTGLKNLLVSGRDKLCRACGSRM